MTQINGVLDCRQPDTKSWILFSGEIHNRIEVNQALRRIGCSLNSGSDSELVQTAYHVWGPECQHRFNGAWAFVTWNADRRQLVCARDRLGIEPLYYRWDGSTFVFASEIEGVAAARSGRADPNDAIVYDYLFHGSLDHTDETFFEGVKRLPASHYLLLDADPRHLTVRRWWDLHINPSLEPTSPAQDQRASHRFRELLTDAVAIRMTGSHVGCLLSGGLDSSSVTVLASRRGGPSIPTFSACFKDPDLDERGYIDQVVTSTGARSYRVFPDGQGLWQQVDDLVREQAEPVGSPGVYLQRCAMRLARDAGVSTLLDGQGADTVLAGPTYYVTYYLSQLAHEHRLWDAVRAGCAAAATTQQSIAMVAALTLYNGASPCTLSPPFRTHPVVPSAMLSRSFVKTFRHSRRCHAKHPPCPDLASGQRRALFSSGLPAALRYGWRNGRAASVRARPLFLDHRLVEYVLSLPVCYRIRDGWTKWILRQAMDGTLPEDVRWRRGKLGFTTPNARWLREGYYYTHYIQSLFAGEPLTARYLTPKAINRVRNLHQDRPPTRGLWRIVNLEAWMQTFWGNQPTGQNPTHTDNK